MRIKVQMKLDWPALYPVLCEAIAFRHRPDGWRPSEYAMTKGRAVEVVRKVENAKKGWMVEAEYFDWSCLLGELARLAHHRRDARALEVFFQLQAECYAVPGVKDVEERTRKIADLEQEIADAEAQLAFMKRQFQQEAIDAQERRHANFQSGLAPGELVATDGGAAPQPEPAPGGRGDKLPARDAAQPAPQVADLTGPARSGPG